MYTALEFRELLRKDVCVVTFTKKDGTVREMLCTLMPAFLPDDPANVRQNGQIDTVVTVWDLEKSDWRAFRVDSVLKVESDETPGNSETEDSSNG